LREIAIMALGAWDSGSRVMPALLGALFARHAFDRLGPIKYGAACRSTSATTNWSRASAHRGGHVPGDPARTILGGSVVLVANGALVVGACGITAATFWRHRGARHSRGPACARPRRHERPHLIRDSVSVVVHVVRRRRAPDADSRDLVVLLFGADRSSPGCRRLPGRAVRERAGRHAGCWRSSPVGVGIGSCGERLLHGDVSAATCRWRRWRWRRAPSICTVRARARAHGGAHGRAGVRPRSPDLAHPRRPAGARDRGGLFCVPLYALLQHESDPAHRARIISANNIINAVAMTVAAIGAAALLARGATIGHVFVSVRPRDHRDRRRRRVDPAPRDREKPRCGWSCGRCTASRSRASSTRARRCPARSSRPTTHRFLDGLLLGAFLPGNPVFAVDTFVARMWWARPFLSLVNAMPSIPTNPLSIRAMIRAVEAGSAVHHLSRGTHHDDRVADEGVRRAGRDCRARGRAARPRPHRGRRVHAVLAPGGQGARPAVPAHPHSASRRRAAWRHPKASPAARGGRRCAARSPTRMVRSSFSSPGSTRRCSTRVEARQTHGSAHLVTDDLEQKPMSYRAVITRATRSVRRWPGGSEEGERVPACCCRLRAPRSSRSSAAGDRAGPRDA